MTKHETELQGAITRKCLDCCGGMRGEVSKCGIKSCPLWAYRPYREKAPRAIKAGTRQMEIFDILEEVRA